MCIWVGVKQLLKEIRGDIQTIVGKINVIMMLTTGPLRPPVLIVLTRLLSIVYFQQLASRPQTPSSLPPPIY